METRQRVTFLFYVKRTKPLKNGEVPIYLRISVNEISEELSTMRSILPEKWDKARNSARGKSKEARELNDEIQNIRSLLKEHVKRLYEQGQEISPSSIKNSYLGIAQGPKKIIALFLEHNKAIKILSGKDFAPATVQRYETCLLHLTGYIKKRYKAGDMQVSKLTPDFVSGFEFYLKTVRKCNHNTTMKYLMNLKKIVRNAFLNGWMGRDPFVNFRLRLEKVDKGYLTTEELDRIMNKKFSIGRLDMVKDVFLIGCFTGLAYSDLKNLKPENIVKGEDGNMWIHTRRQKTNTISHIPILPVAMNIIQKYKFNPLCLANNILLPVYSNQKMNAYLKEIADLCDIKKILSSHMARHTFATTITLNNDIPIETVSKMLGHSSISMTQNYARLLDKKVGKDMAKIMDMYSVKKVNLADIPICLN